MEKRRVDLLPLINPPPCPAVRGVRLRAPPGGMSARSRAGSLGSVKAKCLYETCFVILVRGLTPLCPRSHPMNKECHGNSWKSTAFCGRRWNHIAQTARKGQGFRPFFRVFTALPCGHLRIATQDIDFKTPSRPFPEFPINFSTPAISQHFIGILFIICSYFPPRITPKPPSNGPLPTRTQGFPPPIPRIPMPRNLPVIHGHPGRDTPREAAPRCRLRPRVPPHHPRVPPRVAGPEPTDRPRSLFHCDCKATANTQRFCRPTRIATTRVPQALQKLHGARRSLHAGPENPSAPRPKTARFAQTVGSLRHSGAITLRQKCCQFFMQSIYALAA